MMKKELYNYQKIEAQIELDKKKKQEIQERTRASMSKASQQ